MSHNDGKIPDITAQMVEEKEGEQSNHPTGAAASGQQLPKMKWKKMAMAELLKVSRQLLRDSFLIVKFMVFIAPVDHQLVYCMLEHTLLK